MTHEIEGMYSPVGFSTSPDPLQDKDKYSSYSLYDDTGRICMIMGGGLYRDAQKDAIKRGYNYLFEKCPPGDWHKWYIVDGEYVARPPLMYSLDGMHLKGVPAGATLTIEGKDYTADGTDIELQFSHSGEYTITISAFPHEDCEVTVTYETPA